MRADSKRLRQFCDHDTHRAANARRAGHIVMPPSTNTDPEQHGRRVLWRRVEREDQLAGFSYLKGEKIERGMVFDLKLCGLFVRCPEESKVGRDSAHPSRGSRRRRRPGGLHQ
jgi:hypothetical protein